MANILSIFQRYKPLFSASEFELFLEYCQKNLRKSIRINTLKVTVTNFKEHVSSFQNWNLNPIPWCEEGFFIDRDIKTDPLGLSLEHQNGLFYIQEASSMLPVIILNPNENDLVLDIAAAPGSKTTYIAALMNNKGSIIANDIASKRLKGLESNLKRLGIINTGVMRKNGLIIGKRFPNTFDKILLDAPCSGEGMIRKDRSIANNWCLKNTHFMSKLQKNLIDSAFQALKTGGELVYSTCTFSPEENEEVISYLIDKYKDISEIVDLSNLLKGIDISKSRGLTSFSNNTYHPELTKALRIWPHHFDTEGFFICKIKKLRKTPVNINSTQHVSTSHHYKKLGKKEIMQILTFIKKNYGYSFNLSKTQSFIKYKKDIYLLSKDLESAQKKLVPFLFSGMFLGFQDSKEFKISHEFVTIWGKYFTKQLINLDSKQKDNYFKGKNLELTKHNLKDGTIVLCYNNLAIGKGLLKGNMIKNQLPREYVFKNA